MVADPREMVLAISQIRTDLGTQSRSGLDPEIVDEYAEAMSKGAAFPPVVVFHDGGLYILADGFHRLPATSRSGRQEIVALVYEGDRFDAILYSVGANTTHGRRRSSADKKHAITMILLESKWADATQAWIADVCKTSAGYVNDVRQDLESKGLLLPGNIRKAKIPGGVPRGRPRKEKVAAVQSKPPSKPRGRTMLFTDSPLAEALADKPMAPPQFEPPAEEPPPDLVVEIDQPDDLTRDLESIAKGVRGVKKMWPFNKRNIAAYLRRLADEVEA